MTRFARARLAACRVGFDPGRQPPEQPGRRRARNTRSLDREDHPGHERLADVGADARPRVSPPDAQRGSVRHEAAGPFLAGAADVGRIEPVVAFRGCVKRRVTRRAPRRLGRVAGAARKAGVAGPFAAHRPRRPEFTAIACPFPPQEQPPVGGRHDVDEDVSRHGAAAGRDRRPAAKSHDRARFRTQGFRRDGPEPPAGPRGSRRTRPAAAVPCGPIIRRMAKRRRPGQPAGRRGGPDRC